MKIGNNSNSNTSLRFGEEFYGLIDESRIYDRALTEAEVKTLYMMPGGTRPGKIYADMIEAQSLKAYHITAEAITSEKLATDAIQSRNYVNGTDGSYLNLETGEFKLFDDSTGIVRSLELGPNGGLLAKDANDVVFHDIPDTNVSSDQLYLGHIVWFGEDGVYTLYDETFNTVDFGWKEVQAVTGGYSNVKGGIFNVYGKATKNTADWRISAGNALRPKGTTWSSGVSSNAPGLHSTVREDSGVGTDDLNTVAHQGMLICPIGTSNKVEVYIAGGDVHRIIVAQAGVLI